MGFVAAAIVAPNVPDKVDPIRYLTTPPQSKAQEQAQAQAQALAYAKLHGMSPSELERVIFGVEARNPAMNKPLSREEQQELQNSKTCTIPSKITPPDDIPNTTVDYPYLFTNVRIRGLYQSMDVSRLLGDGEATDRDTSRVGQTKAPVFSLSTAEWEMGPLYLEEIKDELAQHGIVKLKLPRDRAMARIPFAPDLTGFKSKKQTMLAEAKPFDYRQIKRGFFRALIRFHTTTEGIRRMQRFPTLERKPVDFYRLYHLVDLHGGVETVGKKKEWAQVGREMGYSSHSLPTLSSTMRQMYVRILQPFKEWVAAKLPESSSFLDPHAIPRFDVDDVGKSQWHRLDHGIVIDLERVPTTFNTRKLHEFEDPRRGAACYTLKLFKQKHGGDEQHNQPVSDLESQYAELPEWFEAEQMSPRARLFRHPNEAYMLTSTDPTVEKALDPWDVTLLSTRYQKDFFPYITDDDFDAVLISELGACSKFATTEWYRPLAGTYEINTVVDGQPRTWYTKSGAWIDQQCSEVVIVDPNAEVMNWSHGYSVMTTARVMLNSNWLYNASAIDVRAPRVDSPTVCMQHIIYTIAESCAKGEPILPHVKAQALAALELLAHHELDILSKAKFSEKQQKQVPLATPSITCVKTNKRRFFSWVILNGEPVSLETYLDFLGDSDVENAILVSKYETSNPQHFFDDLFKKISNGVVDDPTLWASKVDRQVSFNEKRLPTEHELRELLDAAPEQYQDLAYDLESSIAKLHKWISSGSPKSTFRELVECSDDGSEVADLCHSLAEEARTAKNLWNNFYQLIMGDSTGTPSGTIDPVAQPLNPDVIVDVTSNLLENHGYCMSNNNKTALNEVLELVRWTREVWDVLQQQPDAGSKDGARDPRPRMIALKEESLLREVPQTSLPSMSLFRALQSATDLENRIKGLVQSGSPLTPGRIAEVREAYANWKLTGRPLPIDSELLAQFSLLHGALPLIERMAAPGFLDRPKRNEILQFSSLNVVENALSTLDNWISMAKRLDWVSIATQLRRMATQQPPDHDMGTPISISSIVEVYSQLFYLKIVPDDVASVRTTFENTIERLTRTPLPTVMHYGFVP